MKRKMKVIVLMLLMTFLTSGFALGAEEGKADGEVLMLSLEEALAMARENNQQVKLAKLGLEKAELAREQFRFQDKKRDNLINNPPRKPSEEEALIDPEKYEKDLQDYITWEMTAGACFISVATVRGAVFAAALIFLGVAGAADGATNSASQSCTGLSRWAWSA